MDVFIKNVFSSTVHPPNTYEISFENIENSKQIFNRIFHIYKQGLITLLGKNMEFDISTLTEDNIFTMKQYMKSIGINTTILSLTETDMHDIYDYLYYKLKEKGIKNIVYKIKNKIYQLTILAKIDQISIVDDILKENKYFRGLINMKNPTLLSHHSFKIKLNSKVYMLMFDYL